VDIVDARTGIHWIEVQTCLRLLATKDVGRIGFVLGGAPEILPVNFVLDGDAIVFATAEGSKLRAIPRSPVVFEVDDTDPVSRSGWSVVVHGMAEEVTNFDPPTLLSRVHALPIEPWAAWDKPHLVRIRPTVITGRTVGPPR
jgi:nitroimidazol reductase NimA-like FMN-containing flavoprotein (pyridoxamine 5'-phosphate oxidase superfamily)